MARYRRSLRIGLLTTVLDGADQSSSVVLCPRDPVDGAIEPRLEAHGESIAGIRPNVEEGRRLASFCVTPVDDGPSGAFVRLSVADLAVLESERSNAWDR